MDKKRVIDEIIKDLQLYAEKNGFELNPDKSIVRLLVEGSVDNEINLGERFCSCRAFAGDKKEDSICPCKWHKQEIETKGRCHCGLFLRR